MREIPAIHYAKTPDELHIAYQGFGQGPVDFLWVTEPFSPCDAVWEHPAHLRLWRWLGSFSRTAILDHALQLFRHKGFDNTKMREIAAQAGTALGAAYLAGLATGFWSGVDEVQSFWRAERIFEPSMPSAQRDSLFDGWRTAVARARA